MKYLKYFLVAAVVVLASSYTTGTSRLSEGIYPGDLMPEFTVKDNLGNELDLNYLKGKKVLVNFWAAYDAVSHKNNVLLYNTLERNKYPITMVSVSFDPNESVFKRTLQMDKLDQSFQFQEQGANGSSLYEEHHLKDGFKNYLVDEQGIIIAVNVTPDDLKTIAENNKMI